LFIALSLFLPYFIGLGLLIHSASPQFLRNPPRTNQEVARYLALTLLLGISLNHLLMLLIHDMRISLLIGVTLSAIGFGRAVFITRNTFACFFKLGTFIGLITLCTSVMFSFFILNSQLEWDAQYIWFFHGKMIYYNNGFSQAAGWSNPEYRFSHVDYPKLIAILAAQFAYLAGCWNDYLPRLSLLVLLVPAVLGVGSFFARVNVSFIYLYLMVFFSLNVYTINGYMDAYLAIYACISLLFIWRGSTTDNSDDIVTGFAFCSIIPLLKNEGMLFFVSLICGLIFFLLMYKGRIHSFTRILRIKLFWYMAGLLSSNIIVWSWIKQRWGLKNDLNLGFDSIQKIINRANDGSVFILTDYIFSYTNVGISLFLLLLTIFFSIRSCVFKLESIVFYIFRWNVSNLYVISLRPVVARFFQCLQNVDDGEFIYNRSKLYCTCQYRHQSSP
jgi:hypothetical protein